MTNIDTECKMNPFIIKPPYPASHLFTPNTYATHMISFPTEQLCIPSSPLLSPTVTYEALTIDEQPLDGTQPYILYPNGLMEMKINIAK